MRNPSANITTFSTPFVPAIPGGSTNVISFLGHTDSYVLLENTGELAVSSFTWSAMIFPENSQGPLFNWYVTDPEVLYHGSLIWIVAQSLIKDTFSWPRYSRALSITWQFHSPVFEWMAPRCNLLWWKHWRFSDESRWSRANNDTTSIICSCNSRTSCDGMLILLQLSRSKQSWSKILPGQNVIHVTVEHCQRSQHHEDGYSSVYNGLTTTGHVNSYHPYTDRISWIIVLLCYAPVLTWLLHISFIISCLSRN